MDKPLPRSATAMRQSRRDCAGRAGQGSMVGQRSVRLRHTDRGSAHRGQHHGTGGRAALLPHRKLGLPSAGLRHVGRCVQQPGSARPPPPALPAAEHRAARPGVQSALLAGEPLAGRRVHPACRPTAVDLVVPDVPLLLAAAAAAGGAAASPAGGHHRRRPRGGVHRRVRDGLLRQPDPCLYAVVLPRLADRSGLSARLVHQPLEPARGGHAAFWPPVSSAGCGTGTSRATGCRCAIPTPSPIR